MAVIQLLQSRVSEKWEVQHLIICIVQIQQLLVSNIRHVLREVNGAADHLAKEAASSQFIRVHATVISRGCSAAFLALTDGASLTFAGGDDGITTWAKTLWRRFCGRIGNSGSHRRGRSVL
ncbi:UNVERIFIED_CONTAM: hypothetical protein Sangu_2243400 [Sesamum angustifolium]|uniref:RNase H type-1 domain-containing protein n=1 Tax=Sesamum angustifolium TaxID=2727405 RepID=A0AAW2L6M3_9LAMI